MASAAPTAGSETAKEEAKNMALLFFMDHLMTKTSSRSIHDLSCQFGSRGFTPEMREAVGSTQEGLLEFLGQYPSLFKIEGDLVSVAYGDLTSGSSASPLLASLKSKDRDYEKEAIEFFENKLRKFGPELQIKSLLGHRSQAAPEIRLVSGRHVREFADFLQAQTAHFIVEGDRVRLRNMPEPADPAAEYDIDGLPLSGARAKQAAVEFLRSFLEESEAAQQPPVPMENLYRAFCNRFSHGVRQDVASNPKELLAFLKLNRSVFFIRSNKVSLVKPKQGVNDGADDAGGDSGDNSIDGASEPDSIERETATIRTLKQAQQACEEIGQRPALIGVDFKLVTVGGQDFFSLLALATAARIYLFDVAHSAAIVVESGIRELLESAAVLKVMHDCKRVSLVLREQYATTLRNVYDTQAANAVLQHQRTGRPLNEIKPVTFFTLQRLYAPESLMASDVQLRESPKKDPRVWSQRPLNDELVEIATEQVRLLVPQIYNAMTSIVRPGYDRLVDQVSQDHIESFSVKAEARGPVARRDNFRITVDEKGNDEGAGGRRIVSSNGDAYRGQHGPSMNGTSAPCCACKCHTVINGHHKSPTRRTVDVGMQTISTGDIVMTKIHYEK